MGMQPEGTGCKDSDSATLDSKFGETEDCVSMAEAEGSLDARDNEDSLSMGSFDCDPDGTMTMEPETKCGDSNSESDEVKESLHPGDNDDVTLVNQDNDAVVTSSSNRTNIHPTDLGNFSKPLSYEDRVFLSQSPPFQPKAKDMPDRKFPKDHSGTRKFNPQWYCDSKGNTRQWLTYSIKKDAMICRPCFLFVPDDKFLTKKTGKGRASREWGDKGARDWKRPLEVER